LAEKLTSKVARQATKISQKAEQISAHANKVAEHADRLDRAGQRSDTAFDVWSRTATGTRKPRFTREDIAATAVRIADAEGLDAISMRRLATELDAGTMTLYYYVQTKDELLTLMIDAVMGEFVHPLPAGGWREAISHIARETRRLLQAHPWILETTEANGFGPNAIRHYDQTLEAVARHGGSLEDQLDLAAAVDEYVFGHCMLDAADHTDNQSAAGKSMIRYVNGLLGKGNYPRLDALTNELGLDKTWNRIRAHSRDEDRFERNLTRILDGFDH
jgi:AcrR family transcriptional regulator